MKEFPSEEDLAFLNGLTVSNAILQPYSIDFSFDDGTYLTVEHVLEHIHDNGRRDSFDIQEGYGPLDLHKIVNHRIVGFEREPLRLTLRFDNGHSLRITSILGFYESGHFNRRGECWIF